VSFLLDTNIISEIRKGDRCDPGLSAWYSSVLDDDLHLSTLVLGEIRRGIELVRPRDSQKATTLERCLHQVEATFSARIIGVDNAIADQWGRMSAIRTIPAIDGLLAATALVSGLGVPVLNPFQRP
jgi:hypothetical protein